MPGSLWEWLVAGTGPNYITGLIALVAATFAYKSSRASRASANAASKQLAILETDKIKGQAAGFAVWLSGSTAFMYMTGQNEYGDAEVKPYKTVFRVHFALQNMSALPVYNVLAYMCPEGKSGELLHLLKLGSLPVVPPNSTLEMVVRAVAPEGFNVDVYSAGAIFADAQQRYWNRTPLGELQRIEPAEYYKTLNIEIQGNSDRLANRVTWADSADRDYLYRIRKV